MVAVTAATVHPADGRLGFIGSLDVAGDLVHGAGGTYGKATLLRSSDGGRTFAKLPAPPNSLGLRDALATDDRLWIVGESGLVATTSDAGATWKPITTNSRACLYRIERAPDGWLWITGDGGLVWRTLRGKQLQPVPTKTSGRVFQVFFDPDDAKPWLLDSTGAIQRWKGKGFRVVPAKAMRAPRPLCWLTRTRRRSLVLVGDGGMVLRSTSDGASWKKHPIGSRADLEQVIETMYGLLVVGDQGTLLASCNDGKTFAVIETNMTGHLWSIAAVDGGVLVGGEAGVIYRIPTTELAKLLGAAFERDPVLAGLAARVHDAEPGAEIVLEDALRERGLW